MYVEWDQGFGKNQHDDAGEVHYSLQGTPYYFTLQCRVINDSFMLEASIYWLLRKYFR